MGDLPKVLRRFTAFVDGQGYAGKIVECTPPKLVLKTVEFIGGGMPAPVDIPLSEVEKMVFDVTMKEVNSILGKSFAKPNMPFTARGSQSNGTETEAVIYQMRGLMTENDVGAWKTGGDTQSKYKFTARYLKITVGDEEMAEIDAENMIFKVGGVDLLIEDRKALGL